MYKTTRSLLLLATTAVPILAQAASAGESPAEAYRAYVVAAASAATLSDLDVYMPDRFVQTRREGMAKTVERHRFAGLTLEELERTSLKHMREAATATDLASLRDGSPAYARDPEGREVAFLTVEVHNPRSQKTQTIHPMLEREKGVWKYAGTVTVPPRGKE